MDDAWSSADTVSTVLALVIVGLILLAVLLPARIPRRCPECRVRTLERTGSRRHNRTSLPRWGMVTFREREYRCTSCGATLWH